MPRIKKATDASGNVFYPATISKAVWDVDNNQRLSDTLANVATMSDIPSSLPANGGNASTVNNHTVNSDVPSNAVFTDTTYSAMTGADGTNAGASGLVPAPSATDNNKLLGGDGAWKTGELIHPITNVTGTAAVTTSPYYASIWEGTCDGITSLYTGLMVTVKVPVTGHKTYGVVLDINNLGEHPVVANVNTNVSTRYAEGCIITLIYDAEQTANVYQNGDEPTTVQGCWKIADYDANSDVYMRIYKQMTNNSTWNKDYPLLAGRSLSSAIAETDAKYTTMYGLIGSNSVTPTVNPITGYVKVKGLYLDSVKIESKTASNNGTDLSLVTTGEKATWNAKQNTITFNTAYNASTNKAATMSDIPTVMAASGSGHKGGLVPDPGATAGTSKYLREDGTWATPEGSGGSIVSPTYDSTNHSIVFPNGSGATYNSTTHSIVF